MAIAPAHIIKASLHSTQDPLFRYWHTKTAIGRSQRGEFSNKMSRLVKSLSVYVSILLACFVTRAHPSEAFVFDVQKGNHLPLTSRTCIPTTRSSICLASSPERTEAVNEDIQRAAEQLRKMKSGPSPSGRTRRQVDDSGALLSLEEDGADDQDAYAAERREIFEELRLKPANDLKAELKSLHLKVSGRKPALAQRLADHYIGERQREASADASTNNDGRGDGEIGTVPAQQVED